MFFKTVADEGEMWGWRAWADERKGYTRFGPEGWEGSGGAEESGRVRDVHPPRPNCGPSPLVLGYGHVGRDSFFSEKTIADVGSFFRRGGGERVEWGVS